MKQLLSIACLGLLIVCAGVLTINPESTAHAQTPRDEAASLNKEFANDLPKTYGDAIRDLAHPTTSTTASTLTLRDDQVHAVFTRNARLLGFLPVPVSIEVAVYPDATVRVALPWYRWLLSYEDTASVEADLAQSIQSATTLPSPDGVISTENQQLIAALLPEFISHHFIK